MKYSYNWLKELSGTKNSPEKVAELLTMHSFELEGIEKVGNNLEGVVVGKILEIKKHPNADKLQIVRVDVGKFTSSQPSPYKGEGVLQIICGAPNIAVGQKVPVALVGAKLPASTRGDDRSSKRGGPNGIEIKEAEIRGEKSFGMLCAEDELGLGKNHSGILILEKNAKIGEPAKKYLGVEDDTIFEIKVLPDRAHDAMSHVGVAREISVLENKKFAYDFDELQFEVRPRATRGLTSNLLKVKIEDKKLCSRYIGTVMENVEIKDSPNWMKQRLEASGIRPINNVVDATNYVMLELGQPVHAFDFEKISKQEIRSKRQETRKAQIIIRRAKKNEELELLDETKLKLNENDLLITNGETPLALAGIMGGRDSGINENTKAIVLEAANFNATNIRRSRTRLGIKTESSDRFEKEIDPNLCEKAMARIIEILNHTASAKLEEIVDVYPNKIKSWKIKLDLEYVNSLLGEKVPQKEIIKILNLLGIKIKSQKAKAKKEIIECEVPTFRIDLKTQEDLIEEIGRLWGYEKIEIRPMNEAIVPAKINEQLNFERKIKEKLIDFGFDEMYNYSFYSQIDAKNCGLNEVKHYELANAMSPEQDLVRVNLIPNILKNIRENLKHFEALNIFEVGRAYFPNNNLVEEKRMLVMAEVLLSPWKIDTTDKNKETFYSLKGAVENLLESFGIRNAQFAKPNLKISNLAHSTRTAEIEIGKEKIGMIGEISLVVLGKYKIGKRVAVVEIDLEKMRKVLPKEIIYKQINKFPTVTRDISMIVPNGATYAEIEKIIKKSGGDLVENVSLFDYFPAKNSLAVRISMNAKDRTLESAEIDEAMNKIIKKLKEELNIEIRK